MRAVRLSKHAPGKRGIEPSINPIEKLEAACLTVDETADYLKISKQTIYLMCRAGLLPVVHPVPRRTLVVKRRLDEMLMDGTLGADLSAQDS
jgi:excisionase family DNA binding protein